MMAPLLYRLLHPEIMASIDRLDVRFLLCSRLPIVFEDGPCCFAWGGAYVVRRRFAVGVQNNQKKTLGVSPQPGFPVFPLARYIVAAAPSSSESSEGAEATLEELSNLSVEIEGDDSEASDKDKLLVRIFAGDALARAGKVEEALEDIGYG